MEIAGELHLPADAPAFRGAIATISVLDTTEADAPARRLATISIPGIAHDPGRPARIPFRVEAQLVDPSAIYTVSALLDLDGDGRIGAGDYVHAESYPVPARGARVVVSIRLRRV